MKLNLVACYLLPNGKQFSAVHVVDRTSNLINLNEMTSMTFPGESGALRVSPSVLMACPSKRAARAVADNWNAEACKGGKLWRGELVGESKKESEVAK